MRSSTADILFLILAILIGVLALAGAAAQPPAFFDPLGAGAFPRGIAIIILVLAALKAVAMAVAPRLTGDPQRPAPRLHWRAIAMFAVMCLYLAALLLGLADFRITTAAFLAAGMLLLMVRRPPLAILLVVVGSVLSAVAMDYIFRTIFFLDL